MPEHARAQVKQKVLTDPRGRVVIGERHHAVDDVLEHPYLRRLDRRTERDQHQRGREPPAIRPRERPKPREQLTHGHDRRGGDDALALSTGKQPRVQASEGGAHRPDDDQRAPPKRGPDSMPGPCRVSTSTKTTTSTPQTRSASSACYPTSPT